MAIAFSKVIWGGGMRYSFLTRCRGRRMVPATSATMKKARTMLRNVPMMGAYSAGTPAHASKRPTTTRHAHISKKNPRYKNGSRQLIIDILRNKPSYEK